MRKPAEFVGHPITFEEARGMGYYRAFCKHVVDGDTADVLVDLGMFQYSYATIRIANFDAPEIVGVERAAGFIAKSRLEDVILNRPVLIRTYRDKKSFERFVADMYYHNPIIPAGQWGWNDVVPRLAYAH